MNIVLFNVEPLAYIHELPSFTQIGPGDISFEECSMFSKDHIDANTFVNVIWIYFATCMSMVLKVEKEIYPVV